MAEGSSSRVREIVLEAGVEESKVINNNGESSSVLKIEENNNETKSNSQTDRNSEEANQLLPTDENTAPSEEISSAHEDSNISESLTSAGESAQSISLSTLCIYNGDQRTTRKLLFRKKLFPSDVNDLNRLVIPRKYTLLYFPPLRYTEDGSYTSEILSFTDSQNRTWEMKYVYWDRSQSYVLTRGWKAYVKEYNLQHDDIVEFYELDEYSCPGNISRHYGISHFRPIVFRLFGKNMNVVTTDTTKIGVKPNSRQNHRGRKSTQKDEERLTIQSNNTSTGVELEPPCRKLPRHETTQR